MISITAIATAQNLSNIDSKYGIKKFKLESSYDNYKSNLVLEILIHENHYKQKK